MYNGKSNGNEIMHLIYLFSVLSDYSFICAKYEIATQEENVKGKAIAFTEKQSPLMHLLPFSFNPLVFRLIKIVNPL